MKKQNYLSAIVIFVLSIASFITGFWLGRDDHEQLAHRLLDSIESQNKELALGTKVNLDILISLKQGRQDLAENFLAMKVRNGLKPTPKTGIDYIDRITSLSDPSKETLQKAKQYQEQYCNDKCLGL